MLRDAARLAVGSKLIAACLPAIDGRSQRHSVGSGLPAGAFFDQDISSKRRQVGKNLFGYSER